MFIALLYLQTVSPRPEFIQTLLCLNKNYMRHWNLPIFKFTLYTVVIKDKYFPALLTVWCLSGSKTYLSSLIIQNVDYVRNYKQIGSSSFNFSLYIKLLNSRISFNSYIARQFSQYSYSCKVRYLHSHINNHRKQVTV